MHIDLFSDSSIAATSNRLGKQMETRSFQLQFPIEKLKEYLPPVGDDIVTNIINRLTNIANDSRHYEMIGEAACDSHWVLEALGLGAYTKEWIHVIDFSDALDLIIELQYSCSREESRKIKNYYKVSNSLMNFEFDDNSEKFGVLFFESEIMTKSYISIFSELSENADFITSPQEEQLSRFIFMYYSRILEKTAAVKDYIVSYLQSKVDDTIVYRSKSYSKSIFTSDHEINEDIVLSHYGVRDYTIKVRSYKRYEYAEEVLADELSRKSNHRK